MSLNKNKNNKTRITETINNVSITQIISQMNEWKETYLNDVETYGTENEYRESKAVLDDFIMYVNSLDQSLD